MDKVTLIAFLSMVMWYIIGRFKDFWKEVPHGKYITVALAAVLGFSIVFGFHLDIVAALGFLEETTIMGKIITGLLLMSGSSAISEVIGWFKREKEAPVQISDPSEVIVTSGLLKDESCEIE